MQRGRLYAIAAAVAAVTASAVAGGVVVLAGVWVVNRAARPERPAGSPPGP